MTFYLSVVLSGILTAISFPTLFGSWQLPSLSGLAWFSLIPFYLSLVGRRPRVAAFQGFLFGVVFYTLSLYWIFTAIHQYGDLPVWGGLLGVAGAVLVLSPFVASVAALGAVRSPRWIVFPLAWVSLDLVRNYFPCNGFPWSSLGYSQAPFLALIQVSDVTGIYGVTFLVVLTNAALGELLLFLRKRRPFPIAPLLLASFLLVGSFVYGRWRIHQIEGEATSWTKKKVALVQANIPQDEKWLMTMADLILNRHIAMSEEALKKPIDLLIWPEASYPEAIPPERKRLSPLKDLKVPLLVGAVTYTGTIPEEWPPRPGDTRFALYNSALVVEPGGVITQRYHKTHLVPMGEYVPLGRILFFLQKIVPALSSFTPGKELNLLSAAGAKIGVTICYEDLFPQISRSFVRQGADLLVNLTNDAWYGSSSASIHHFDFSRFRAVENRRTLVRVTNNGVTGIFEPTGKVLVRAPVATESVLSAEVGLGGPTSFYTRFGDLFAWGCFVCLGILVLLRWSGRKENA